MGRAEEEEQGEGDLPIRLEQAGPRQSNRAAGVLQAPFHNLEMGGRRSAHRSTLRTEKAIV